MEIPNSVTEIGTYAFYGCTSLTSVEIPNSVTEIGTYAFYGCTSLTSVEIPNSVTEIGDYAFFYCQNLTSVDIGNGVTSIGNSAFAYCANVTSITIRATTPPTLGTDAIAVNPNGMSIIVPPGCIQAYKEVTNWANYADYMVEDLV